jgi:ATP-dependent DNA ligase
VEPYLGGVRAALIFRGAKGIAVTLLGREVPNAANILAEIEASDLVENIVIDGELLNRYDVKRTAEVTSAVKFTRDELDFYAYDVMTIEHWDDKICEMPLHYRKSVLAALLLRGNYQRTLFTPAAFANDIVEMKKLQRSYKAKGYEAAVFKDVEAPYPFGATLDWLVDRG